ncbi:hypothetical protein M2277_003335 [Paenibacillus sp. LBL]|nr:hypothetical protein [Paenibacillus sp. LBL]
MKRKIALWLVTVIVTISISIPLHAAEPIYVQLYTHGGGAY